MAANNILFLTLRVFSAAGGIEKVCKVVSKSIADIAQQEPFFKNFALLSMYDEPGDADRKYINPVQFRGFGQHKLSFAKVAIRKGIRCKLIVLSHINLLSIGYVIKLIAPSAKLVIFAHGIEVWGRLSYFKKMMLSKCDMVIAVSEFTRNTIIKDQGIAPERVVVLNNCLDPFLPEPVATGKTTALQQLYGIDKDDVVLMTLTRLSSRELYKGYDSVLTAVEQLKASYPSVKYLVVGKYDPVEKERLDRLVYKANLKESVIFTGYITDEDLARHFSLADLYVMPSKKEGFGIVFIEAMYYGLPVIAGNKDGSVDALLNGKLGVLVDPDNQEEITNAIESILSHKGVKKPDARLLEMHFGFEGYKQRLKGIVQNLVNQ